MSPGYAVATKLVGPADSPDEQVSLPDAGPGHSWDEGVPPPGRDATLLAVVPIPGTGTSLAIVGYAIDTTSGAITSGGVTPGAMTSGAMTSGGSASIAIASGAAPSGWTAPGGPERRPARSGPAGGRPADAGLHLDRVQRRVWAGGREVMLTYQEFELLAFLAARPATVFSRADLVEHVWQRDAPRIGRDTARDPRAVARDSRTVDVHVSRVRHKLGPVHGQCLVTEYRVGYQFRPVAP